MDTHGTGIPVSQLADMLDAMRDLVPRGNPGQSDPGQSTSVTSSSGNQYQFGAGGVTEVSNVLSFGRTGEGQSNQLNNAEVPQNSRSMTANVDNVEMEETKYGSIPVKISTLEPNSPIFGRAVVIGRDGSKVENNLQTPRFINTFLNAARSGFENLYSQSCSIRSQLPRNDNGLCFNSDRNGSFTIDYMACTDTYYECRRRYAIVKKCQFGLVYDPYVGDCTLPHSCKSPIEPVIGRKLCESKFGLVGRSDEDSLPTPSFISTARNYESIRTVGSPYHCNRYFICNEILDGQNQGTGKFNVTLQMCPGAETVFDSLSSRCTPRSIATCARIRHIYYSRDGNELQSEHKQQAEYIAATRQRMAFLKRIRDFGNQVKYNQDKPSGANDLIGELNPYRLPGNVLRRNKRQGTDGGSQETKPHRELVHDHYFCLSRDNGYCPYEHKQQQANGSYSAYSVACLDGYYVCKHRTALLKFCPDGELFAIFPGTCMLSAMCPKLSIASQGYATPVLPRPVYQARTALNTQTAVPVHAPRRAPAVASRPAPAVVVRPVPRMVFQPVQAVPLRPAPAVVLRPAPAVVQRPAPAVVQRPAPAVVQRPAPAVVLRPALAVILRPAPAVLLRPAPAVLLRQAPAVVPRPAPAVVPRPAPAVVPQPAPAVVPRPAPAVVPRPAPAVVLRPAPVVAPRPAPVVALDWFHI